METFIGTAGHPDYWKTLKMMAKHEDDYTESSTVGEVEEEKEVETHIETVEINLEEEWNKWNDREKYPNNHSKIDKDGKVKEDRHPVKRFIMTFGPEVKDEFKTYREKVRVEEKIEMKYIHKIKKKYTLRNVEVDKANVARERYKERIGHHLHIPIIVKDLDQITKRDIYPMAYKFAEENGLGKNVHVETEYWSDDDCLEYTVCPKKNDDKNTEKPLDTNLACIGTTVEEILRRNRDKMNHKAKTTPEQYKELDDAIESGMDMKRLMKLNNLTLQIMKQKGPQGCRKWLEDYMAMNESEDEDEGIPDYNPDDHEVPYQDHYGLEDLRKYILQLRTSMHKKPRFPYLYGESNTFKTTTIERICHEERLRMYRVPASLREMGDLNPDKVDVMLFDEWSLESYNFNMKRMKTFLEGTETKFDVKYGGQVKIDVKKNRIIAIFCANDEGAPWLFDNAFQNRIRRFNQIYN